MKQTVTSMSSTNKRLQVLLAPASGHGRFVVILSSSVTGELARRSAPGRMGAYAEAIRLIRERAAAEASHAVARMHGEAVTIRIEIAIK